MLTGVTTPVAAEAALHQSINDHGVTKMRPVGSLPIESGKPVTLAPGGYHIMLMGLKQMSGMDHGNISGMGDMPMPGSGKQP